MAVQPATATTQRLPTTAKLTPRKLQRRAAADGAKLTHAIKRIVHIKKRNADKTSELLDGFVKEEVKAWQERRETRRQAIAEAIQALEASAKEELADLSRFARTMDESQDDAQDAVESAVVVFKDE